MWKAVLEGAFISGAYERYEEHKFCSCSLIDYVQTENIVLSGFYIEEFFGLDRNIWKNVKMTLCKILVSTVLNITVLVS